MRLLGEIMTDKDAQTLARVISCVLVAALAAWPIYKWYQAIFGRFVTIEAFRARTDLLDERLRALETYRAHAEEERTEKLMKRVEELELLLGERDERRRKH